MYLIILNPARQFNNPQNLQVILQRTGVTYVDINYMENVTAYVQRYSRRSPYYFNAYGVTKQSWTNNVTVSFNVDLKWFCICSFSVTISQCYQTFPKWGIYYQYQINYGWCIYLLLLLNIWRYIPLVKTVFLTFQWIQVNVVMIDLNFVIRYFS